MKKINTAIIATVAASLVLVAGCYEGGNPQEAVPGYSGLIAAGWEDFEAGDYEAARINFQAAVDMDVTQPIGFLGAAWSMIMLPDYWVVGDQYCYMAVQLDGGTWPLDSHMQTAYQDLNWTTFQCIDPVLTANDMLVIGSWGTTDTLVVIDGADTTVVFEPDSIKPAMDNYEIGQWLHSQYGAIDFKYTYEINDPDVVALFNIFNGFSQLDCPVDSIVNGATSSTVYLHVPYKVQPVGDDNYRTWCMYENGMSYNYTSYTPAGGNSAITPDAIAAYGILQHGRGVNGDALAGVATLIGLADEVEYSFSHFDGLTSLKLKGMAAAIAFANTDFRFALDVCRSEGYALDVSIDDSDFIVELMSAIESMLQ